MKRLATVFLVLISALGLAVSAAAKKGPPCEKDGKTYGEVEGNFREEWYSYQERADSYAAGECWDAAKDDYERAIELREGVDRAAKVPGCDTRRARSYGMHFVEWFGHRGRGVALFNLGDMDGAIEELELSLQCTESSQAQYYLDKARAGKLKTSGGDSEDPEVSSIKVISSEPSVDFVMESSPSAPAGYEQVASPYYFTEDEIAELLEAVSGKDRKQLEKSLKVGWGSKVIRWKSDDDVTGAPVKEGTLYLVIESSDDQGVQIVEANGTQSPYTFSQKTRADVFPVMIQAAAEDTQEGMSEEEQTPMDLFTVPLQKSDGQVTLSVAVTDLLGKKSRENVQFTIDREGPRVYIDDVQEAPGGKAQIKGTIDEASGMKSFEFGGVTPKNLGGGKFEVTAPLQADRVKFIAVDSAGNETSGVLVLGPKTKGTRAPSPIRWTRMIDRFYSLASAGTSDARPIMLPPKGMVVEPWNRNKQVWERAVPDYSEPVKVAVETELYWNALQETMGIEDKPPQIFLKTKPQTVFSNQLYIEGSVVGQGSMVKQVFVGKKQVMRAPKTNAFFNELVYLRTGQNIIHIRAIDEKGQEEVVTLKVTRVVPRVRSVAERLSVSMLPFFQDPNFKDIGDVAYDNLSTALIRQRRFKYIDRSQVDSVVRELRLSGTGLTDPTSAVRAGKRSSAEAIIMGVVRETDTSIELKAQVVDVDSSRVMVTRDAFHQDKSLSNLQFITQGLAVKLQNSFPIVQGNIAQASGNNMQVTLGRNNRILPGMKVVLFKVVAQTDQAGNSLGADTQKIGEGKITAISNSSSSVQVISSSTSPAGGDLVITK